MVRLEWAHIEAFDDAGEKVLGPEDLIELGPGFRAGLQPYIRLLELEYPVDKLRIQVNQASDEHEEASNAVLKQQGMARRVIRLKPERNPISPCIGWTSPSITEGSPLKSFDYSTRFAKGRRSSRQFSMDSRTATAPLDEQRLNLEKWLAGWAELGWLCPPPKVKKERVAE